MTVPWYRKANREAEIERLRQVIAWRREGKTYREIGELLGVSKCRAHQLAYKSQTFVELHEPGVSALFDKRGSSFRTIEGWVKSMDPDY
jgi:hypothetical protein